MPLVADYSGSDSDSDSDTENVKGTREKADDKKQKEYEDIDNFTFIKDEDEWQSSVTTKMGDSNDLLGNDLFHNLPRPNANKIDFGEEVEDEFLKKKPITEHARMLKDEEKLENNNKIDNKEKKHIHPKRSLLSLPKPSKGSKNKKQPVKISIPTLSEIGADSDSDEESTKRKEKRVNVATRSDRASALFSMLPKPRHSVSVGENKNKVFEKQANRVLMPHTLTKKVENKTVVINKNKTNILKKPQLIDMEVDGDDNDDDDEEVSDNFFLITDSTEVKQPDITTSATDGKNIETSSPKKISMPGEITAPKIDARTSDDVPLSKKSEVNKENSSNVVSANNKGNSYFASLFSKNDKKNDSKGIEKDAKTTNKNVNARQNTDSLKTTVTICNTSVTRPYVQNDSGGVTRPYGDNSSYRNVTRPYDNSGSNVETSKHVSTAYGNSSNVSRTFGHDSYSAVTRPYGDNMSSNSGGNEMNNSSYLYPLQPPQQQTSQPKSFFAYEHESGKQETDDSIDYYNQPNQDLPIEQEALTALQGRKRRNEEINLIDINASDLTGNSDDYLKNLTKESGYQAKKPKNKQPSSMDKRKHQITYLAFQAKEREFELRQSWADSRASKQQTQSRYGF